MTGLHILNTDTTPEEIAALVASLLILEAPATPKRHAPSEWPVTNRLRNSHLLRSRSWRASALQR